MIRLLERRLEQCIASALVTSVDFMPDNKQLLVVDDRSRLRIWAETNDETAAQTLFDKNIEFTSARSKLGFKVSHYLSRRNQQPVCCWDVVTGALVRKVDGAKLLRALPHPSKPIVYLASRQGGLKAWDYAADELRTLSKNSVVDLALLADGVFTIEYPEDTSFKLMDIIQEPRSSLATIRGYSMESGQETITIASTDGSLQSSLSINSGQNQ